MTKNISYCHRSSQAAFETFIDSHWYKSYKINVIIAWLWQWPARCCFQWSLFVSNITGKQLQLSYRVCLFVSNIMEKRLQLSYRVCLFVSNIVEKRLQLSYRVCLFVSNITGKQLQLSYRVCLFVSNIVEKQLQLSYRVVLKTENRFGFGLKKPNCPENWHPYMWFSDRNCVQSAIQIKSDKLQYQKSGMHSSFNIAVTLNYYIRAHSK